MPNGFLELYIQGDFWNNSIPICNWTVLGTGESNVWRGGVCQSTSMSEAIDCTGCPNDPRLASVVLLKLANVET